jgi:HPt (histidine-containing phosphotransfer) domain-containing protein
MEPKYFDPEALYSLLGDDKATILKMLENILIGVGRKSNTLNANLALQDWVLMKGDAHFLKSNFRYLGAKEMAAVLKEIEHNSLEEGDRSVIPALVAQFYQDFPAIIKEVEEYISYLKAE